MIRFWILMVAVLSVAAPAPAAAQFPELVVLLVNPRSGVKSVSDFSAWTKRSKKPLAYSSSGPDSQRFAEALAKKFEIKAVHVPYRDPSHGIFDLVGGHIDFALVDVDEALGQIRAGRLTALAAAGRQRFRDLPDVPTFAEAGYPELAAVFPASRSQ
jgi:tripartite-type tricarboxylate transporter receptor subunit TctC